MIVYKIENLINHKCYIGSSITDKKRWYQHKTDAFNPNDAKYMYPLYAAFRKYGLKNFSWDILKSDFSTIQEMQQYEASMIQEYNTLLPNGYNQTLETDSHNIARENCQIHIASISQPCALIDSNTHQIIRKYPSLNAAARDNGLDNMVSHLNEVCKGELYAIHNLVFRYLNTNDEIIEPIQKTRKRCTAICGINKDDPTDIVYYNSISEAARLEQIERSSLSKCVNGSSRYSTVKNRIWKKVGDNK